MANMLPCPQRPLARCIATRFLAVAGTHPKTSDTFRAARASKRVECHFFTDSFCCATLPGSSWLPSSVTHSLQHLPVTSTKETTFTMTGIEAVAYLIGKYPDRLFSENDLKVLLKEHAPNRSAAGMATLILNCTNNRDVDRNGRDTLQ